ncbi:hypothetical protein HRI_000774400 [Hibiscus trionum]|uniref:Uncharacterized protein n=1 Tax=Hibiscus trionum TaxID=183268 RepID=A0A9W7H6K8_HIBTR|nr:hypothetical protein HRI_000774400 [Hibiscus trionum]
MLDLWGGHRQNSHTSATNSPLLPTSTTNVLNHPHSQQARPKMIYQLIPTLVATRTMSVTVAAELTLSLSMTFYRGICNSTITKLTNFTVSDIDIDTDLAHEGLIGKAAGKGWDIHSLHRFLGYNYSGHNDTTSSLSKMQDVWTR